MNNLRKLLLLIPITIIFLLFVTNKTYAQFPNEDYPFIMEKIKFYSLTRLPDNINTYEFEVAYRISYTFYYIDFTNYEYFFITCHNIPFQKHVINRKTNAYKLIRKTENRISSYTSFYLQVTLEKSFVDEYYSLDRNDDNYISKFFEEHSAFYVIDSPVTSGSDYSNGYTRGYNDGEQIGYDYAYPIGYNIGYRDGYIRGLDENYQNGYNSGYGFGYDDGFDQGVEDTITKYYNEGYKEGFSDWFNDKFTNNFYIWLIPAIILIFGIGIFVSYRKEGE